MEPYVVAGEHCKHLLFGCHNDEFSLFFDDYWKILECETYKTKTKGKKQANRSNVNNEAKKNASLYLWNITLWYCLCAIFRSYFAIIYIAYYLYVINKIITISEAPAHFAEKIPTYSSSVVFGVLKFIFKIYQFGDFGLLL